jgi:hypothetical protein
MGYKILFFSVYKISVVEADHCVLPYCLALLLKLTVLFGLIVKADCFVSPYCLALLLKLTVLFCLIVKVDCLVLPYC